MGYTHNWGHGDIQPDAWAALVADAKRIIRAAGVRLAGPHGKGKPVLNEAEIALNGVAPDDWCESFMIFPGSVSFEFCKTASRPYDVVVTTILLRARLTIPGFKVGSDGYWSEWQPARDLYARLFGDAPDDSPLGRD